MSKILKFFLLLITLITLSLLVAPEFIDFSKHRKSFILQVSETSGQNFSFQDNDVKITFLPIPQILIENVKFQKSGFDKPTIESKFMEATLNIGQLLKQKITASTISLSNATLNLEIDEEGKKNFDGFLKPTSGSIKKIEITDSQINFQNHQAQNFYKFRKIDLTTELTNEGINLSFTGKDQIEPLTLTAKLNQAQNNAELSFFSDSFQIDYRGNLNMQNFELEQINSTGTLEAKIKNLQIFSRNYLGLSIHQKLTNEQEIAFKTKANFENLRLNLEKINFDSNIIKGSGKLSAELKLKNLVDLELDIQELNLDALFNQTNQNEAMIDDSTSLYQEKLMLKKSFNLPKNLNLLTLIKIDRAIFTNREIKDTKINCELIDQKLEFYPSDFTLPGNLKIAFDGELVTNKIRSLFSGKIRGSGDNFAETKEFLNIPQLEQTNLKSPFNLNSEIIITKNELRLQNYNVFLQKTHANGDIVFKLDKSNFGQFEPEIFVNMHINEIDLDEFGIRPLLHGASEFINIQSKNRLDEKIKKIRNLNFKTNLDLNFDILRSGNEKYENVFLALDLEPSQIIIRKFDVSSKDNDFTFFASFDARALKNKLTMALGGNKFNLNFLKEFMPKSEETETNENDTEYFWSIKKFPDWKFPNTEVSFDMALKNFNAGELNFKNTNFKSSIDYDILKINKFSTEIFDGKIQSSANFNLDSNNFILSLGVNNINFSKIPHINQIFKGFASVSGSISSYGNSMYETALNSNANLSFAIRHLEVPGFSLDDIINLPSKANMLSEEEIDNKLELASSNGSSFIKNLDGFLKINLGNMSFNKTSFSNQRLNGVLAGTGHLAKMHFNINSKMSFIPYQDASKIDIDLKNFGTYQKMENEFNFTNLKNFILLKKQEFQTKNKNKEKNP